jgi:hypothetical protein
MLTSGDGKGTMTYPINIYNDTVFDMDGIKTQ